MDQNSRTSSVYSSDTSSRKPLHLESRTNAISGSNSRPSSRAASYTPSYMSNLATKAPNGHRSNPIPISRTPMRTAPEPPTMTPHEPAGGLLIFSPGQLHPSLLSCLEILLQRQALSSIVIAASKTQEAALKQLRMDVFALLGKMSREVIVSVDMQDNWTRPEVENALQQAKKSGQGLQGVLCCPELLQGNKASDSVLELDETDLEETWTRSVGFLHMTSRTALPHLLANSKPGQASNGNHSKSMRGPFFLVTKPATSSVASEIVKASFDALISQLEKATRSQGLTVGHAEAMLIPEPRSDTLPIQDEPLPQPEYYTAEETVFTPSESPTKLWNMWALQNDTPTFDS